MRRLIACFCVLAAVYAVNIGAQEPNSQAAQQGDTVSVSRDPPAQGLPRFRGRSLVVDISASVVEENETVSWNESQKKTTLPGRPVGVKLVGSNIVVVAQFTPYIRQGGQAFLVAQGQIWTEVPGHGISYYTSMQTIPLVFGEPIYFFPLGPHKSDNSARIEVKVTLYPYEE